MRPLSVALVTIIAFGAGLLTGPDSTAAPLPPKPAPARGIIRVPEAPTDPARQELVRALHAARRAGGETIARALALRLSATAATGEAPGAVGSPPLRPGLVRIEPAVTGTKATLWGDDVLMTDPTSNSSRPALACTGDGTLYVAVERPGEKRIDVLRSQDGGTSWSYVFYVVSEATLAEPCVAIGEGGTSRLLVGMVMGSGTSDASVVVVARDLPDGVPDIVSALPFPYLAITHPRLCVDSPEYSNWYPYLVAMVQSVDTDAVCFTRSFDRGATWQPSTTLATTGVTLQDWPDIDFGGGTLAVAYTLNDGDSSLRLRLSRDFGGTWEPVIPLTGVGRDELEPRLAATVSGDLLMVAFARRYAPQNCDIECLWSTDSGATWNYDYLPYTSTDERRPSVVASPATGQLHVSFWRGGEIQYTSATQPQTANWSPALTLSDRSAAADAWPALAVRPASCACHPDMNCDGVVDANDFAPFDLAMIDPVGYGQAYPNCDIAQADTDCDDDIDPDDRAVLECLAGGGSNCCPASAECAGVAWHDGSSPAAGAWFDAACVPPPTPFEYLVICPDSFAVEAERLVTYRRGRGLTGGVVQLSDVAPGTPTAATIDAWLETFWADHPSLRFVALAGDVTLLPSFPLTFPDSGEPFYSDLRYGFRDAEFPGNYLPQLVVGRLPVCSRAQFAEAIEKLQRFEGGYGSRDRVVFFGNQPEMGYVATRDSALAAGLGYDVVTLYSPTEAELMGALNAPQVAMVFYYGHGSFAQNWPLHVGNLDLLTNSERPWLYFSGGCSFHDDYSHPMPIGRALALSEAGAAAATGGAVAGGFGYNYTCACAYLQQSRVQQTVGEAVAAALHQHHATALGAGQDVGYGSWVYWFTERMRFVGDPALRIDGDVTAVTPGPTSALHLAQNRPNPFSATTTVAFTLPAAGHVRLAVYSVSGRLVARLLDATRAAGAQAVTWDGRDTQGRACPSGVYFCLLEAGGWHATRKTALVR